MDDLKYTTASNIINLRQKAGMTQSELAALINANPALEARLSRPTPTTQLGTSNASSLAARVNDANSWGADYFISLHTSSV